VFDALQTGKIKPAVEQRFKLDQVQDAHRALEARETIGATVLVP
jgi:NADPH2:quinone reductase